MILSHYTDRGGLEGIARSKAFWATNFLNVNDTTEYFFAWKQIIGHALDAMLSQLPVDLKRADIDLEAHTTASIEQFRSFVNPMEGYGHLYVTSFARGQTPDHEERGILTLWDRYTNLEGYCLQFEQTDVTRILELEASKASYAWLGLANIKYGIDESEREFKELSFQLSQKLLLRVAQDRPDRRLDIQFEKMWPDSTFEQRTMRFCATHKDPCYEDEREMRIFGYPAEKTQIQFLTGIASKKPIQKTATGKKYIIVGNIWRPGIEPCRIIIGPRANPDIAKILAMFAHPPVVAHADLPIV
jgi:hypothetical protein